MKKYSIKKEECENLEKNEIKAKLGRESLKLAVAIVVGLVSGKIFIETDLDSNFLYPASLTTLTFALKFAKDGLVNSIDYIKVLKKEKDGEKKCLK